MRKVHKLKIDFEVSDYKLPEGAQIVQFCEDGNGDLCIWYVFGFNHYTPREVEYVHRSLHVYGTDHEVPNSLAYIGTAICGRFVWHLFEGNKTIAEQVIEGDMEGSAIGDHLRENM